MCYDIHDNVVKTSAETRLNEQGHDFEQDGFNKISQTQNAHLQWIPSDVNISGNEVADRLAEEREREGSENEMAACSIKRAILNLIWRNPSTHQWYTETTPGYLMEIQCDSGFQIALTRLTNAHLKYISFDSGKKIRLTCKKCCDHPDSPDGIMRCIGLPKRELTSDLSRISNTNK
ncbi:RNase H domain-containing protein [Trichonephila clavipes]|nr:RNase H domain-containing protein [Trichonephila clavipes]